MELLLARTQREDRESQGSQGDRDRQIDHELRDRDPVADDRARVHRDPRVRAAPERQCRQQREERDEQQDRRSAHSRDALHRTSLSAVAARRP